ncbi:MAG: M23 family metallopeptidase [Gemmatimonadota bacterium]
MKGNPYKAAVLAVATLVGLGGVTILERPADMPAPTVDTPILDAVYARPVEDVETHVLEPGQTLGAVLSRAAITGNELADLLLALRQQHSPRRLKPGAEVTVRRWQNTAEPRLVDVRVNADSTVRLARSDFGWQSQLLLTPTRVDTVVVEGSITTSLWDALVLESTAPVSDRYVLARGLADVYQFQLDFNREIQPGDGFRFVYEREARPDGTARGTMILAAEMTSGGQSYPAIWYESPRDANVAGYYTHEGRSIQQGFSRYPVDYGVTSGFNPRRYHPVLGIYRAHQGTDYGAPAGTPVKATANGTVSFAGADGGYGNLVRVRHFSGYETRYAHLSRIQVRRGDKVKLGDVVGRVGATGLVTGAHLHYELRENGVAIDARKVKLPDAPAIAGAARAAFDSVAAARWQLLGVGWSAERKADTPAPAAAAGS